MGAVGAASGGFAHDADLEPAMPGKAGMYMMLWIRTWLPAGLAVAALVGCSQEQKSSWDEGHQRRVQKWNSFWGAEPKPVHLAKSTPAEDPSSPDANPDEAAPEISPAASEQPAPNADPNVARVQEMVEDYSTQMAPPSQKQAGASDAGTTAGETSGADAEISTMDKPTANTVVDRQGGGHEADPRHARTDELREPRSGRTESYLAHADAGSSAPASGSAGDQTDAEDQPPVYTSDMEHDPSTPAGSTASGEITLSAAETSGGAATDANPPVTGAVNASRESSTSGEIAASPAAVPDEPAPEGPQLNHASGDSAARSAAADASGTGTDAGEPVADSAHAAEAPSLAGVRIAAGPEPEPQPQPPAAPASGGVSADEPAASVAATPPSPEVVDTMQQRLNDLETRLSGNPNDVQAQVDMRILKIATGREEQALEATQGVNQETQDLTVTLVKTLLAARDADPRDPSAAANKQLEAVTQLHDVVSSRADLRIPKAALCTWIYGFGLYDPIEPAEFAHGAKSEVYIYIEVDNFKSERKQTGQYRTVLALRLSLLRPTGEEIWTERIDKIEDLSWQRRRDFYLRYGPMAALGKLDAGEYVLKIEVEDVFAGKFNTETLKFRVTAD